LFTNSRLLLTALPAKTHIAACFSFAPSMSAIFSRSRNRAHVLNRFWKSYIRRILILAIPVPIGPTGPNRKCAKSEVCRMRSISSKWDTHIAAPREKQGTFQGVFDWLCRRGEANADFSDEKIAHLQRSRYKDACLFW
jgi:hypothetical protein